MKTQIFFISAVVVFSMIACDEETVKPTTYPKTIYNIPPSTTIIRSVYPQAGEAGTHVAIFGDNFGPTASDNYVTFNSEPAEITYVGYGMLSVVVPSYLAEGEYTIKVNAIGHTATAPNNFRVLKSQY